MAAVMMAEPVRDMGSLLEGQISTNPQVSQGDSRFLTQAVVDSSQDDV